MYTHDVTGLVVAVNEHSGLAALSIGTREALVFEFPKGDSLLCFGDHLGPLHPVCGHTYRVKPHNQMEFEVNVLCGVMPVELAKFIVCTAN